MIKYIGVYKCRRCGDQFTDPQCVVEAETAREALEEMHHRNRMSPCYDCNLGPLGIVYGYGKLIGVQE